MSAILYWPATTVIVTLLSPPSAVETMLPAVIDHVAAGAIAGTASNAPNVKASVSPARLETRPGLLMTDVEA